MFDVIKSTKLQQSVVTFCYAILKLLLTPVCGEPQIWKLLQVAAQVFNKNTNHTPIVWTSYLITWGSCDNSYLDRPFMLPPKEGCFASYTNHATDQKNNYWCSVNDSQKW